MAKDYTQMLGAAPAAAPSGAAPSGGAPKPQKNYADMILNQPTGTVGPAERPIPGGGVVDDLSRGAGFWTTARASLAPDIEDQIKRFAEARGIAPSLYGVLDGEIVFYDAPNNQLVREVPSIGEGEGPVDTFFRVGRRLATQIGPSIPGVAAGVAGTVTGPTGLSILAASGTAGAADLLRQLADRALAGEDLTDVDYLNAAGQAVLGGLQQGTGVLANRAFTRNALGVDAAERTTATNPANIAAWQQLRRDATREGIDLTAGELTDLASLKAQERALRRFPETADPMNRFIQERNTQQVPDAMRRFIGQAPPSEVATGNMIRGAQDVIQGAVEARTRVASPLYESAFNSGTAPDIRPVVNAIVDRMDEAARNSATSRALTRVRNMLGETDEAGNFIPETNYRRLHSAKLEIDAMLDDLENSGQAADRFARRALTDVQRQLTDVLRATHPDYEAGYQAFLNASPLIDDLRRGGVGVVSRLNGQERAQLLDAVFSANRIAPGDVLAARRAFERAGRTQEWNDGVNAWLSNKLEQAMRVNASGQPGNVPGKIVASVWGTEPQREVVRAALGNSGRVNGIERLMEVLRAASRSLPEGSPTATDLNAMAQMTDQASRGVRLAGKVLSPQTYFEGGTAVAEAVVRLRAPAARRQLAEALMSPDALDELKKLQMLSPRSEKALNITAGLLARAGLLTGVGATGLGVPADRLPDDMPPAPQN